MIKTRVRQYGFRYNQWRTQVKLYISFDSRLKLKISESTSSGKEIIVVLAE